MDYIDIDELIQKGDKIFNEGLFEKSLDIYQAASSQINESDLDDDYVRALYVKVRYNLGTNFTKLKRFNEAITVYEKTLNNISKHKNQHEGTLHKLYYNLSCCHAMVDSYKLAHIYANRAHILNPEDSTCLKLIEKTSEMLVSNCL